MLNNLPNDPMMLLSVINTKLRDIYKDLDALCDDIDIDRKDIEDKLSMIDYEYDSTLNKFV